ncbi:5'-nucleotidase [Chitinivorax tropicus]|uniref:5'-nucleotidase n=1 Tax=Chitinivorax tropicus TaxID=714531 RepID=A0A840MR66_9PROT|nr:5'-nucleotidase [Chitinivorax tropicus]MBB5019597.1 5'-nucleotidase [Chitinivorax tropicus]
MPYDLDSRLVIGLASSALFDLQDSDRVFRQQGEAAYRAYQRQHQRTPLAQGVAFPFIKRLLSINAIRPDDPPIEVILLSRNDPDTGMRVMDSIKHHGLDMTRAVFLQGRSPYRYIPALNISLFLSANEQDVKQAMDAGYPAGQVLPTPGADDPDDHELRIALDFDGVLADDQAEAVFQETHDINRFHEHEQQWVDVPHNPGPLADFLKKLSQIQQLELASAADNDSYQPRLRVSIVTARNAPSHERVINTMRSWGIVVNEAFFLGGVAKSRVLEIMRPHIFFDDQRLHLEPTSAALPSVHIPFGVTNRRREE